MKEKLLNFVDDVTKEMGKVTWPTQAELMESTKIVVIVSLAIAIFAYGVDLMISEALKRIL
jgi:preprotein translocase subunit SecE